MTTALALFPWVKESPLGWSVVKLKFCLRNGRDGSRIGPFGSALPLSEMVADGYKVYGQENIIANDFSVGRRFISEDKFKEMEIYSVFPQDVLITMMGTVGRCRIVPDNIQRGIIDSHLLRLRTKSNLINSSYFEWVIGESNISKDQSDLLSKGSIMSGLNSGTVRDMLIPLPPLETQKLIAHFLDRKTAAIDTLIAKKQRLIQLLEEKRTALINQAVTKGLNPNARSLSRC
jgi:type I restriction enzyme, S subunit